MQKEKGYIQHGRFSVYAHSFLVASLCVYIAKGSPSGMTHAPSSEARFFTTISCTIGTRPTNPTDFTLFPTPDARLKTRGGIFV